MYYLQTVCAEGNLDVCHVYLCEEVSVVREKLAAEAWKRFVISEVSIIRQNK